MHLCGKGSAARPGTPWAKQLLATSSASADSASDCGHNSLPQSKKKATAPKATPNSTSATGLFSQIPPSWRRSTSNHPALPTPGSDLSEVGILHSPSSHQTSTKPHTNPLPNQLPPPPLLKTYPTTQNTSSYPPTSPPTTPPAQTLHHPPPRKKKDAKTENIHD